MMKNWISPADEAKIKARGAKEERERMISRLKAEKDELKALVKKSISASNVERAYQLTQEMKEIECMISYIKNFR